MKIISRLIMTLLFLVTQPALASPYDKWSLCEHDSDCVVTRAPCGITGVHTQYLKDAEEYWRIQAPKVECSSSGPTDISIFKSTCAYAKIPCVKKNWLGMDNGIDHESTCISSEKKCIVSQ